MSGAPPLAPRQPHDVSVHGDPRSDDYFWLRERDDPRTLAYLRAENAYADAWFAPHAALKETLYQEMFSRIQQDDDSVPMRKGGWWYSTQTRTGEQYPRLLRRRAIGSDRRFDPEGVDEVLLDLNQMAVGKPFLRLGFSTVSRDASRLAYSVDFTGGRDFTLHVKELASGVVDPWSVEQVASAAWANDSRTLYYVTMDETKRANRLWRHVVGAALADELLFEEDDELFDIGVAKTLDERFLLVGSESKDSSEWRVADADAGADTPFALRTVFARRADIEYDIEHRAGRFYVRINDTGRNFRLVSIAADAADLARAEELIAARADVMLDAVDVFAGHLSVTERVAGSLQLRIIELAGGGSHTVAFDEPAYSVHTSGNAEFETSSLRFVYTSLTVPASTYDYDLATRERVLKKRQPVPGYEPSPYASERIVATAKDGTAVPISIVYRRDQRGDGPQPLLLYGYGSYGIPIDPTFSQTRVSLARSRRGVRDRPHPRRWRSRPQLVRGRQDGEEADHLRRLHRLRRSARRGAADDAGAARDRGRQRRRAADGRGRQPAARAVSRRRRRGAVRGRRHDHARRDACRSPSASSSSGATRSCRSSTRGCAPTAPTTT